MRGIANPTQGAGMFYQNMLEPASSADERNALLPRGSDGGKGGFRVAVRTARPNHHRPVIGYRTPIQLIRADHTATRRHATGRRGMVERRERRNEVRLFLGQVYQHGNVEASHGP